MSQILLHNDPAEEKKSRGAEMANQPFKTRLGPWNLELAVAY